MVHNKRRNKQNAFCICSYGKIKVRKKNSKKKKKNGRIRQNLA